MSTCLQLAPFTGQAITAGAAPGFAFTEQQSDMHVSLPYPNHIAPTNLVIGWPSPVARDSLHLSWLSPASRCWFLHRRRSPTLVSFHNVLLPSKHQRLFRALSSL